MNRSIDRRTLLKAAFGAGVASIVPSPLFAQQPAAQGAATGFRFVHMTDIHVQPERAADRGMIKALAAVEKLAPKPDFILSGGDQIYDCFDQDEARSRMLFDMFCRIAREHTNLKMYCAIGNHDVFGWSRKHEVPRDHKSYGKHMACEAFQLPNRYYAFDHLGWRFYVLDTIQPTADNRYEGYLDEEQMDWLKSDLATKPATTPAVVLTHIPILTVTGLRDFVESSDGNQYRVSTSLMCRGTLQLSELFGKHNVRLALSGHVHELDRVELRGVNYVCGGAVSGNWWKGVYKGYEEGFGIVDLKPTGAVEYQYFDYGWEAEV